MRYGRFIPALMMAIALVFAGFGQAEAQQPMPQQQQEIEVTDELLERFVAVYPDMYEINQAAERDLANVTDPAEAQAIQQRAQVEMIETLEEGEISVPEYEAVVQALNTDEELRAQFEEMLDDDPRL